MPDPTSLHDAAPDLLRMAQAIAALPDDAVPAGCLPSAWRAVQDTARAAVAKAGA